MKHLSTFLILLFITITSLQAQDNKLPYYYQIPDYPEKYTAETVVARMIDGLGFRYYWATEGLREEDLAYKASESGRTSEETIDHIYGLTMFTLGAVNIEANKTKEEVEQMTFADKRKQTLLNIEMIAELLRKTEDLIEFNSNLGYRPDSLSNWFYSARLNFKTQFSNGYQYPDTEKPISRFMAPGYLFFGVGMEYGKNIDKLSFYFSPLTFKTTFVLDQDLANAGAFGVKPAEYDALGNIITKGERLQRELGILLTNSYEMEIVDNITMRHLVSLYTDYINSFGNIDVDWQITFDFKVNNFIKATFGSHIRYDDDVKIKKPTEIEGEFEEVGAKVQWKQFLGIGFAVDF